MACFRFYHILSSPVCFLFYEDMSGDMTKKEMNMYESDMEWLVYAIFSSMCTYVF